MPTKENKNNLFEVSEINAIQEIANQSINVIFDELGVSNTLRDNYPKYMNGPCFMHGGTRPSSFSWDYRRNRFKCWTKACHEGGDNVFCLVSKTKDINFREAVLWIIKVLDIDLNKLEISHDNIENVDFIRNTQKISQEEVIEESILSSMKPAVDLLKDRNIPKNILEKYNPVVGVKWAGSKEINMIGRVAFPVRNKQIEIIGFTGRQIKKNLNYFK